MLQLYIIYSNIKGLVCFNGCVNGCFNHVSMDFPGILTLCTTRPSTGFVQIAGLLIYANFGRFPLDNAPILGRGQSSVPRPRPNISSVSRSQTGAGIFLHIQPPPSSFGIRIHLFTCKLFFILTQNCA